MVISGQMFYLCFTTQEKALATITVTKAFTFLSWSRPESNWEHRLRRPGLYPFNYGTKLQFANCSWQFANETANDQ